MVYQEFLYPGYIQVPIGRALLSPEPDLLVLISRVRDEQQIDMGGFVDSPDLSLRVPKVAFPGPLPKFGERIEVDGTEYRITRVSNHPRSPLLTLSLSSTDE